MQKISLLLLLIFTSCKETRPYFLSEGIYQIEKVGCGRPSQFREVDDQYYSSNPSDMSPLISSYLLDFDNLIERKLKLNTQFLTISLSTKECHLQVLLSLKENSHGKIVTEGKVAIKDTPSLCFFNKTIFGKKLKFNIEDFARNNFLLSYKRPPNFREIYWTVSQKNKKYFLSASSVDYKNKPANEKIYLKSFRLCSPSNIITWELKKE